MTSQSVISGSKLDTLSVAEKLEQQQEEADDKLFEFSVIKPSHIVKFERSGKIKKAIHDHIGWYYRPRSPFEPERIDYNCLNILAEYQTYNFEMCR